MLKQVYGEEALSRSRTFEWFKRFRDGRESVEDDPHTGRQDGVIHHEFLPPNMTINGQFYTEVLDRLRKRIRRVRPHFRQNGSWLLLHDNARPHIALPVRLFLAQHCVVELQHPPYSPDLAPADFFLFPKLKHSMKGTMFQDVEAIKKTVTSLLKTIPKEDFKTSFRNLHSRAQTCITADGDYFESY
ncbi:hypothetical protein RF55_22900 [Lasius niger]|uniref:Mos1 transposase HTH domain-containing protein n=1 Tax=Lasius niger TaxID=67767 RepID=A0A0J7JW46_LASNI|nr:hypothetical protein RF55_22900 [Lasius niger]